MTFLPIAERELRVAARKRSTFWVRIAAALVALLIGSGFLVLTTFAGFGFGLAGLGHGLFAVLTWLSLAAALSAGLFLTSDCLSEEKREGTLGLLFLTDLRGYDVVLGKFLATSLQGLYALLAVFPILAVTLLMGGVTGAQFWKTSLALINAMFLSVAAGLFVSAISRDSQKALASTLFLLLLLVAAGPAGDATMAAVRARTFNPVLSLSSPGYLFVTAGTWAGTPFWLGLLVNQAVAWLLFGLTCLLVPRTWQEKATRISSAGGDWAHWWKFGGAKRRATLRRKLVGVNPILWLGCRERWQAASLWIATILLVGGFVAICASGGEWASWSFWSSLAGAFTLVLYLGVASQAGRLFVEARRSGLIESLLATPLTAHEIVQGQWRALARMFGLPLVLCLATQLLGTFQAQQQTWGRFGAVAPPATLAASKRSVTTGTTNLSVVTTTTGTGTMAVTVGGGLPLPNQFVSAAVSVAGTLVVIGNLVALIWVGMWMGLNSKNANVSTLKTILFVQVIPWFIVSFASTLVVTLVLMPGLIRRGSIAPAVWIMTWYPLLTSAFATVLYVTKDAAFWFWARRKLHSEFRQRASRTVASVPLALPPPLPRADVPPVISPA